MAGKADFTEQEWDDLRRGVTGAGMLVSVSDMDFTDSFKESGAMAKALAAARTTSTSELVREIAARKGTGFGAVASPTEVREGVTSALTASVAVLGAKAPDDLEAYRTLVLDVAAAVAGAAKGGDEAESAAIARIKEALGLV